jgi:hypothetical protein
MSVFLKNIIILHHCTNCHKLQERAEYFVAQTENIIYVIQYLIALFLVFDLFVQHSLCSLDIMRDICTDLVLLSVLLSIQLWL